MHGVVGVGWSALLINVVEEIMVDRMGSMVSLWYDACRCQTQVSEVTDGSIW